MTLNKETADELFAKARQDGKLTNEGLRALSRDERYSLIGYLTHHRLPVYEALIGFNYAQRRAVLLLGYSRGYQTAEGLDVLRVPEAAHVDSRHRAFEPITLEEVARITPLKGGLGYFRGKRPRIGQQGHE